MGGKGAKHRGDSKEGKQICAVKTISEGVCQAGKRTAQQKSFSWFLRCSETEPVISLLPLVIGVGLRVEAESINRADSQG